jgi:hypothetical protein
MPNYFVHTKAKNYSMFVKQRPEMEFIALNSILLVNLGTRALHYTLEHYWLVSRETSSSFSMVMYQTEYLKNQGSL